MDSFYSTVLIVAFVVLVLALVLLGVALAYPNSDKTPFPMFSNSCPDYWSFDASKERCYVPTVHQNKGNVLSSSKSFLHKDNVGSYITPTEHTLCDWKTWTSTYGITWDGVSNNNQC